MNNSLISENRLPSGWEFKNLKDITCSFKSGFSITSENISEDTTLFPVYGGNGLRGYTSTFTHDSAYTLIGRQGALCGNLNYVEGKSFISEHAIAVKANNENETKFLYYNFSRLNLNKLSEASAQPGLSVEKLLKLETLVPPLAEQQKIAQALTDADNYISALEKLIEKKKMIKEGLMANLLTGKQRLKEFAFNEDGTAKGYKDSELGKIPEDWEIGNLGNLTTLKARIGWQGLTVAEYLDQGDYYLVTGTDFNEGFIDFDHCPYVDKSRYSQDPNIQLKNNDVLVTKDGTIGKVAFIENLDLPATLNSGVFVVRPIGSGINSKFLYYILMSKYFDDFLKKITAGSTITHLYQKDFVHFDFVLPTLEEQNSIVNCLSNVDHDLKILKKKLTKAKNLKQGMMQKLLTGEIRLA